MSISLSNATALALGRADFARGSGSALLGASQFDLAAPGAGGDATAIPLLILLVVFGLRSIGAGLLASLTLSSKS
ncbi:MAG: hypothetical protein KF761_08090 [Salinibacterium sp.]|nr:hypothetical protein [Salinibacterium sp.]